MTKIISPLELDIPQEIHEALGVVTTFLKKNRIESLCGLSDRHVLENRERCIRDFSKYLEQEEVYYKSLSDHECYDPSLAKDYSNQYKMYKNIRARLMKDCSFLEQK